MSTTLTNGIEIVWGVFNSDGYECSDLVGVFDSATAAETAAERITVLIKEFYAAHMDGMQWSGSVVVTPLTINNYELPGDAACAERERLESSR